MLDFIIYFASKHFYLGPAYKNFIFAFSKRLNKDFINTIIIKTYIDDSNSCEDFSILKNILIYKHTYTHVGFHYFLCFSSNTCLIELGLCACVALFYVTVYCCNQGACNLGTRPLYTSGQDVIIFGTNFSFAVARAAVFMCQ